MITAQRHEPSRAEDAPDLKVFNFARLQSQLFHVDAVVLFTDRMLAQLQEYTHVVSNLYRVPQYRIPWTDVMNTSLVDDLQRFSNKQNLTSKTLTDSNTLVSIILLYYLRLSDGLVAIIRLGEQAHISALSVSFPRRRRDIAALFDKTYILTPTS